MYECITLKYSMYKYKWIVKYIIIWLNVWYAFMYIMNLKYLRVNYALFIRRLCQHVFVRRPSRPSTKCPRDKNGRRRSVPQRNSLRRSVQAAKRQATKCTCGETAGDETAGDETVATKRRWRKWVYPLWDRLRHRRAMRISIGWR